MARSQAKATPISRPRVISAPVRSPPSSTPSATAAPIPRSTRCSPRPAPGRATARSRRSSRWRASSASPSTTATRKKTLRGSPRRCSARAMTAKWHRSAGTLRQLPWPPSDPDPRARASIAAFRDTGAAPNLLPPLDLDVMAAAWPVAGAAAVVCINMIHIAPCSACEGLVAGAARALPPGGVLYLYGPYKEEGRHTAPSNAAFDADLRARDTRSGVRDLGAVAALARRGGFAHEETVTIPVNNRSLVFRRGD